MNHTTLVKKLTVLGYAIQHNTNGEYWAENHFKVISWYVQEGSIVCLNVRRENDHSDFQSDYHAGMFCRTIKHAIQAFQEVPDYRFKLIAKYIKNSRKLSPSPPSNRGKDERTSRKTSGMASLDFRSEMASRI